MKRQFGTDINKLKYEVCVEVARLAFAGELEEKRDEIPYTIIPGSTPVTVAVFTVNGKLSVRE